MKKLMLGIALLMLFTLSGLFAQEPPQNVNAVGNTNSMNITWDDPPGAPINVTYLVWRLFPGQEVDESTWSCITPNAILSNSIIDGDWFHLPHLAYRWAVKAVYPGYVISTPAYSNTVYVPLLFCTITGVVRNSLMQGIPNATVSCENNTTTTDMAGAYTLYTYPGIHTITANHPEYEQTTISNVDVYYEQVYTLNITLHGYNHSFHDSFETYEDFSLSFGPWITDDVDMSETTALDGYTWTNATLPQAYIVFNPTATTPPLPGLTAHSGDKMLACFSATMPPNMDWLISPVVYSPLEIRFFARSLSGSNGLERFRVGVSLGQTVPAAFNLLSTDWITVPETWTQYAFYLGNYYAQNVRVGIVCGTNEGSALLIDDVVIEPNGAGDDPESPANSQAITGNYPNPFAEGTTITFSLRESSNIRMEIYNLRGQKVRTLTQGAISGGKNEIYWDGLDDAGNPVCKGVYFCRMSTGQEISTRKLLLVR